MKIISINAEKTKNHLDVTFNLDESIPENVLNEVSYGHLLLSCDRGSKLLRIENNQSDEHITSSNIKELNQRIAKANSKIEQEVKMEKESHARTLAFISESTGLPID